MGTMESRSTPEGQAMPREIRSCGPVGERGGNNPFYPEILPQRDPHLKHRISKVEVLRQPGG